MKIEVTGLKVAIGSLDKLRAGLGDLDVVMSQLGVVLANSTRDRFRTQTDPSGSHWAELAPETRERKARLGRGDRIWVDTGETLNSITFDSDANSAFIYSAQGNQGKVAGNQFGVRERNLPARALFGFSQKDEGNVTSVITGWIEGLL